MSKKEKVFFKVVIPVFDAEEWVEKSVKSVVNQTFKDYVVVCVNDKCRDNTFEIVKSIAKDNERIVCVEPEKKVWNGGARNIGIHYDIESEYTLFLDNDDWFYDENVFQKIHDNIVENGYPDLVRLSYNCLVGKSSQYVELSEGNIKDLCCSLYVAPWTKCVKSSLLVDFPENTLIEDVVQHIGQCDNIESVSLLKSPCVVWNRNNVNSASLKENQKTLLNGKRVSSVYRNIADLMDLVCVHDYAEEHRLWRLGCYKNLVREGKEEHF